MQNNHESNVQRVEALEVKASFLEDTVQQLNDEILLLQRELQSLKLLASTLKGKVDTIESGETLMTIASDETPPHY